MPGPPGKLYVGTSGFGYPEWRGGFYPADLPAGRFLSEYAKRLYAVEVNNTFQRLPGEAALAKWVRDTPPGFKLCLKAQRALTYSAQGFPKDIVARDFGTRMQPLGNRAGPVLLQFPPTQKRSPELLELLLVNLGRPAAVEFRDPGWLDAEIYAVVERHRCAVVVTDQEDWPLADAAGAFRYYRLRRDYSEEQLGPWAERLASEVASGLEVFAFLRHSEEAPQRALQLRAFAADRR
jgi:uncharacterized protein YecE (DUF72 family)